VQRGCRLHWYVPSHLQQPQALCNSESFALMARVDAGDCVQVGEAELTLMRRILREIGHAHARTALPAFPVDNQYLPMLRKRIRVAQRIDDVLKKNKKQQAESEWLRKAAADMEVDLSDDEHADIAYESRQTRRTLQNHQRELDAMLKTPLRPAKGGFVMDPSAARQIVAATIKPQDGSSRALPLCQVWKLHVCR
jgi:hypothetical protein